VNVQAISPQRTSLLGRLWLELKVGAILPQPSRQPGGLLLVSNVSARLRKRSFRIVCGPHRSTRVDKLFRLAVTSLSDTASDKLVALIFAQTHILPTMRTAIDD